MAVAAASSSGPTPPAALDPSQSAAVRQRLLAETENIASADLAATWAREALPAKNGFTADDAKLVEEAFERRLADIASSETEVKAIDDGVVALAPPSPSTAAVEARQATADPAEQTSEAAPASADRAEPNAGPATGIDKSVLAIAAPRRYRNRDHLRFVAQQPCLICGRKPSDPHHLRQMQPAALGRKASDEFAVPLCRSHHRAVHRAGDERTW